MIYWKDFILDENIGAILNVDGLRDDQKMTNSQSQSSEDKKDMSLKNATVIQLNKDTNFNRGENE
mgnify:CR=1 FL=1